MRLRTRLALLALATLPTMVHAVRYEAPVDQATWESVDGDNACHLVHDIPFFGVSMFSEGADGRASFSVFAEKPPVGEDLAVIYVSPPRWREGEDLRLESTRIANEPRVVFLSHVTARRLQLALQEGRQPQFRMPGFWGDEQTRLVISNVGFRQAMQAHMRCLQALQNTLPKAARQTKYPLRHDTAMAENAGITPESDAMLNGGNPAPSLIYFETDSDTLDLTSMQRIQAFAKRVLASGNDTVVISSGYADPRGTSRYNAALSSRRAATVKAYLTSLGLNPELIEIRAFGESIPAATGDDEESLALNRRVLLEMASSGQ